jgi:hypothetical protein
MGFVTDDYRMIMDAFSKKQTLALKQKIIGSGMNWKYAKMAVFCTGW